MHVSLACMCLLHACACCMHVSIASMCLLHAYVICVPRGVRRQVGRPQLGHGYLSGTDPTRALMSQQAWAPQSLLVSTTEGIRVPSMQTLKGCYEKRRHNESDSGCVASCAK